MSLEALLAGIGALLTATIGLMLIIREFRYREHKAARLEIAHLTDDLYSLDQAYIEFRKYAHALRQLLADAGIDAPAPPSLHSYDTPIPDDVATGHRRRLLHRERSADVHDSSDSGDGRPSGE